MITWVDKPGRKRYIVVPVNRENDIRQCVFQDSFVSCLAVMYQTSMVHGVVTVQRCGMSFGGRHVSGISWRKMRRDPKKPAIFVARIDKHEKNMLDNILPMQGGRKWAIEVALEAFLDRVEGDVETIQRIRDEIIEARSLPPPINPENIQPLIRADLHKRFNDLFWEKGGTAWFLRKFVSKYIDVQGTRPLPEDTVREAVKKMLEEAA